MKEKIITILIVLALIFFIYFYIKIGNFTPKDNEFLNEIRKLELKVDSLNRSKDSIKTVIDSTHIKIITNEKHYQERINTILIQSSSADSSFVSNYIRQYADKNSLFNSK